jgi:hypothetical protein
VLPQKISNVEIVVVVGADAEDVPSSIVEYLIAVVVVAVASECEEKERQVGLWKDPTLTGKTRTHTYKVTYFSTFTNKFTIECNPPCVVYAVVRHGYPCHESLILSYQRRQDHDGEIKPRYRINIS